MYANMLEAAIKCGIKKFPIFYEAYPDPGDFKVHLHLLVQNGLLMKERYNSRLDNDDNNNSNGYYRATNKGFVYHELYRELERLGPSLTVYVGN